MADIPPALRDVLDAVASMDRTDRMNTLIDYSDQFREVPTDVATRPFPEDHRVPRCESEAFVWAVAQENGTLKFHFAVENPNGVSARALAALLDETLSGAPLEQVAAVPPEVVYDLFGREISMGRGEGLMGMVAMVTAAAKQALRHQRSVSEDR